jgi:TorA maturation chaperone TorD
MTNNLTPTSKNQPKARAFSLLAQVAQGRSEMYQYLALTFYPPDEYLLQTIQSRSFLEELNQATSWLGTDQEILLQSLTAIRKKARSLEFIQYEYQRLSGKSVDRIPMVESAYRWRDASNILKDHVLILDTLKQEYALHGISTIGLDPDHVAVQLEFLAYLTQQEAMMWKKFEGDAARQLRRSERVFLTDHLGRWMPEFLQRIQDHMPWSIYSDFAHLANAWIHMEYGPGYFSEFKA